MSNKMINDISQSLNELDKEVGGLQEIQATIKSISDNTKMLSLNASIESARVGEAGRGFAVVAQNIGDLAIKTNAEIEKIKPIVQNIQKRTADNKKQMNRIVEDNDKILTSSQDIYASSEEVSAVLNEIISEVGQISDENQIALQEAEREKYELENE